MNIVVLRPLSFQMSNSAGEKSTLNNNESNNSNEGSEGNSTNEMATPFLADCSLTALKAPRETFSQRAGSPYSRNQGLPSKRTTSSSSSSSASSSISSSSSLLSSTSAVTESPSLPSPTVEDSTPPTSVEKAGGSVCLVVDDNQVNRDIVSRHLFHFKITHDLAASGQEAVELAKLHRYQFILMDISMP